MKFKESAKIELLHPELLNVLKKIDEYSLKYLDYEITVTSGHETTSKHSDRSKHYIKNNPSGFGCAIDLRINDLNIRQGLSWFVNIWGVFINRKDILIIPEYFALPNRHIHIQVNL